MHGVGWEGDGVTLLCYLRYTDRVVDDAYADPSDERHDSRRQRNDLSTFVVRISVQFTCTYLPHSPEHRR